MPVREIPETDLPTSTSVPLGLCRITWRLRYVLLLMTLSGAQYGIVFPSTFYISQSFFAGNSTNCEDAPASPPCREGATTLLWWMSTSGAVSGSLAWAVALGFGAWSDKIGRLPILRVKAVAALLPIGCLALYVFYGVSLWLYLVLTLALDIFDTGPIYSAFLTDVIPEKGSRAKSFAVMTIIGGAAFTIIFPLAGKLESSVAVAASFGVSILKFLFVVACVPETASPSEARQQAGPCASFGLAHAILKRNRIFACVSVILMSSGISYAGLFIIKHTWMTGWIGMTKEQFVSYLSVVSASILFGMVFILGPLVRCLGEVGALRFSLMLAVFYPFALQCCDTFWQATAVTAIFTAPTVIQFPIVAAIKSNIVRQDEQGLVQGYLSAIRVGATVLGDLLFGWLFRWSTDGGKGDRESTYLPFAALSVFSFFAFAFAFTLPRTLPAAESQELELAAPVEVEERNDLSVSMF